jgi:hypothetical protein
VKKAFTSKRFFIPYIKAAGACASSFFFNAGTTFNVVNKVEKLGLSATDSCWITSESLLLFTIEMECRDEIVSLNKICKSLYLIPWSGNEFVARHA